MPRNPAGTPAVRTLIAKLADLGIEATPARIGTLATSGLGPRVTGSTAPTADVVEHYQHVYPLSAQRRERHKVVLTACIEGAPLFDDSMIRRALLESFGIPADKHPNFAVPINEKTINDLVNTVKKNAVEDMQERRHRSLSKRNLSLSASLQRTESNWTHDQNISELSSGYILDKLKDHPERGGLGFKAVDEYLRSESHRDENETEKQNITDAATDMVGQMLSDTDEVKLGILNSVPNVRQLIASSVTMPIETLSQCAQILHAVIKPVSLICDGMDLDKHISNCITIAQMTCGLSIMPPPVISALQRVLENSSIPPRSEIA